MPAGIGALLLSLVGSIFSKIISWVVGTIWQGLMTIVSVWTMWTFHALNKMFPKQAAKLWEGIVDTYYTMPAEWAAPIASYIENMTGERVDISDITGGAFNISSALGAKFLYPMLNLVLPGAEVRPGVARPGEARLTPEDGLRGAESFLGANLHFQMSAWLLHVLGDMQSFGMFKSLKDLPNAISWSYGLGWLSWLVMGVPFRMGISDPLERYFNLLYRPKGLPRSQVFSLWNSGDMPSAEALERLREEGWGEEEIAYLRVLERERLSEGEMMRLWREGLLSNEDVYAIFRERGHPAEEARALGDTLRRRESQALLERIAAEALELYEAGAFTWDQTIPYLNEAHYKAGEISLLRVLSQMKRIPRPPAAPTERELTPAQIGSRYQDRALTLTQARMMLTELNFREDQIDLFLGGYEPAVPKEEEPREITLGIVGGLFRRGEITEAQLRADLLTLGYSGWSIERAVRYYWPPEPPEPVVRPPKELPATWIFQLHEEGLLPTTQAIQRMVALGYRAVDARTVLELLHPARVPEEQPERVLPASVAGSLYRDGEITRTVAMTLFRGAGYSAEASEYLELYYRPEEPAPEVETPYRALPASWVFQLHSECQITTDQGVARLVELNIAPEDARLVLERLHPCLPPDEQPARVIPASISGGLYRDGSITQAQAMAMWADAGYDQEGQWALELYYRPEVVAAPEPVPPRELSAEWVLRLHREAHITTPDAQQRLVALGFRAEDATLLLTTLYAPPAPAEQPPRAVSVAMLGALYQRGRLDADEFRELATAAGYDEQGVTYLELYYRPAEAVAPTPRELRPSEVGRLYRAGSLTYANAYARVRPEFVSDEDTHLFLELYAPTEE